MLQRVSDATVPHRSTTAGSPSADSLETSLAASQILKPNALAALEHYKQKDASKGGSVLNHLG